MSFEWPLLLLSLAVLPLLALAYLIVQRRRRAYAVRFTNLDLLAQVAGRGPGIRRHIPPALYLLGMAALLVSLARPSAVIAMPRDEANVVLVLDVSGSMAATDLQPDRLEAAKRAAERFVDALPANAQVSLVSFSTNASVNAPLTRDHEAVKSAIRRLRANGGTAIGDGLLAALGQLRAEAAPAEGGAPPALVILLSDGASSAGVSPNQAAAEAVAAGVRVHTVGIGQRGAAPIVNGQVPAVLDERTLQTIATETGGQYFYAAEAGDLERIYRDLGSQVRWVTEETEVTALVSGLGALLLLAGGLLGLRWFQRLP
ncbi:MAG: aerotolerance regulator BatA [Dehalococcoidia bacterium]|nr:MAG: aerotolerance regulator BatA [Dehalococcoidia bacterium]